jgi:polysaccharide pyruvyl transferase WcaK-like protein
MKKYIDISGLNLHDSNRGTAALGYGAIPFLEAKGYLKDGQELILFHRYKRFWKRSNTKVLYEELHINGKTYKRTIVPIHDIEYRLVQRLGIILPFTQFGRYVREVELEAAIYGGDGFSDIYGTRSFMGRLNQTRILRRANVPLLFLPQTIGPFKDRQNYDVATRLLRYAKKIYVRDNKFASELDKLGLQYTQTPDLSSFMVPEPWDIEIKHNAVGLNVSGLAYSNSFHKLKRQFDTYPELIERIICYFRAKGCTIYLIPHAYNYNKPIADDDMLACREAYRKLENKSGVVLIDRDLISPQIKYLISKMTFFIGARMHANFAAIYTGVPVFGMAYSYKFEGAFNAGGLDSKEQTAMINNLRTEDIDDYITKIDNLYQKTVNKG